MKNVMKNFTYFLKGFSKATMAGGFNDKEHLYTAPPKNRGAPYH